MKINCLSCGHNIDLDDAYAENYEGSIKCFGCSATLEIKTEQSAVRFVHLNSGPASRPHRERHHNSSAHGGASGSVEPNQGKVA